MDGNFMPILVVPAVLHNGGIRFLHREDQIDIGHEMADTVWKILSYCSGYTEVSDIVDCSGLPEDDILEILTELEDMELVVDARRQFMHFHRISNYPTAVNSGLTQQEIEDYTKSERLPVKEGEIVHFELDQASTLCQVRAHRRSCRNFSDKKLTVDQVGNICQYAYSIPDHATPSGGALYPLKIYVLIEKPQVDLTIGYYEYDAEKKSSCAF